MQYWSPYHIIPKDLRKGSFPDKGMIKKAKKRWIAEFDVQNSPTIMVKDKELDKNAILQLFEQFENEQTIEFHTEIYKRPELLNFLESGDPAIFQKKDEITLLMLEPGFAKFVGPYFAERYNELLYKALKNHDAAEVKKLCSNISYMTGSFESSCFQKSFRFINLKAVELQDVSKKSVDQYVEDGAVLHLFPPSFIKTINNLPGYFDTAINKYTKETEDLAINLHNSQRRSTLATYALKQGLQINCTEETAGRLDHILNQISSNSRVVSQKNLNYKPDRPLFWKVFFVGHLIFFLLAMLVIIFS